MHTHSKQQESHEHQHRKPNPSLSSSRRYEKLKLLAMAVVGFGLLTVSGLALTGTVLSLAVATPLLVLFSPILVPAGIVLSLSTAGFVFSGSCGVAGVNTLTWLYGYVSRELARARAKSSLSSLAYIS